jgi:hypothetical protein
MCFVVRASRYNGVKKNQLGAQLILRIFRQPLQVSGVSKPIISGGTTVVYNNWYLLFFLDDCCPGWTGIQSNPILLMGLDTHETCGGWRNILRIRCASSWFFFTPLFCTTQVLYTKIVFTLKIVWLQLPHGCALFKKYTHFAMKILQSIKETIVLQLNPNLRVVVFCSTEKVVPDISQECKCFKTSGTRVCLKCGGTRTETRFCLLGKTDESV